MSQSQRKNVFISYSHADVEWLERLRIHLKPLDRKGVIALWSDEKIQPGSNWREEIRKALNEAKFAVLLVSAAFLASDFIDEDELPHLLAAAEKEDALILPVIVSPCMFEQTSSMSKYQAVNSPTKPLSDLSWSEQEKIFVKVAKAILSEIKGREDNNKEKGSIEPKGNITISKIKLRSQPIENLTKDAVEIMIKDKGFFDLELNKLGTGFPHQYELQKDGRVVYDQASGLLWQRSGSANGISYKKAKTYVASLNSQHLPVIATGGCLPWKRQCR